MYLHSPINSTIHETQLNTCPNSLSYSGLKKFNLYYKVHIKLITSSREGSYSHKEVTECKQVSSRKLSCTKDLGSDSQVVQVSVDLSASMELC